MKDVVAEPVRAKQVPGFADVIEASRRSGAIAAGLSGSGPSIFAFCRGRSRAQSVSAAMKDAFERATDGAADAWTSAVGAHGARVLD